MSNAIYCISGSQSPGLGGPKPPSTGPGDTGGL